MLFKSLLLSLLAFGLLILPARSQDLLSNSRTELSSAYTDVRYDQLCAILHPDASFRGSLKPDRWSHSADNIVKERWNVSPDCDCKHTELCKPSVPSSAASPGPRPFTVGQSALILTPDPTHGPTQFGNYLIDTGQFKMQAKSGDKSKDITNPYVMIWINTAATDKPPLWKIILIDMHPCDETVGPCS